MFLQVVAGEINIFLVLCSREIRTNSFWRWLFWYYWLIIIITIISIIITIVLIIIIIIRNNIIVTNIIAVAIIIDTTIIIVNFRYISNHVSYASQLMALLFAIIYILKNQINSSLSNKTSGIVSHGSLLILSLHRNTSQKHQRAHALVAVARRGSSPPPFRSLFTCSLRLRGGGRGDVRCLPP